MPTFKFVTPDGDTRRVSVPSLPDYSTLLSLIDGLFHWGSIRIQYEDQDGDRCTISTDVELAEAFSHISSSAGADTVIRFFVSPLTTASSSTTTTTPNPTPTTTDNARSTPLSSTTPTTPTVASSSSSSPTNPTQPPDIMALIAQFMTKGQGAAMTHAVAPLILAQIKEHPEILQSAGPMIGELLGKNSGIAVAAVPFLLEQLIKHPELIRTLGPYILELLVCIRDSTPEPTLLQKILPILLGHLIKHPELLESFGPILLKVAHGADSSEILPPLATLVLQQPELLVSLGPLVGKLLLAGAIPGGANTNNSSSRNTLSTPTPTGAAPAFDLTQLGNLVRDFASNFNIPPPPPTSEPVVEPLCSSEELSDSNIAVPAEQQVQPDYSAEIRQLRDMGFEYEDSVVISVLQSTNGDVARAIDQLIQSSLD